MKIKKNYLAYVKKLDSWGKRFKMMEWIARNKGLWGPFPIYAKIEIDQRCNLRCPKCYRNEVIHNKFLSMEQFKEILDKLEPGLCEVWTHGFGEPTMHPQFLDMMEEVRRRGMLWGLATNGATKFFDDEDNVFQMMELLPEKIRFSVDAANIDVFERERFPAEFGKVWANISTTVSIRNIVQENLKRKSRIDLYCVLTMQTLDEIGPMIDLRDELDCDWITFSDLAWNNAYGTSVENNAVRQMMSVKEIEDLIAPYKKISKVQFNIPRPEKRTCDYPKFHIYIDAEGFIFPCTCVPGKEKPFANIFEIDNIKEVYQSNIYNEFREMSKYGHIPSDECFRCLQWGPDYSDV